MQCSKRTASTVRSSSSTTTRPTARARSSTGSQQRYPVRCLHRPGKMGLSSGVIDGWKFARPESEALGAMDADFSHDPQGDPGRWSRRSRAASTVLRSASRYVPGGGIENWPLRRKITSLVAIALAKPLTPVRDITSRFFSRQARALEGVELDPIGFKIGLEVIAKAHYGRAIEVPYVFTDRVAGTRSSTRARSSTTCASSDASIARSSWEVCAASADAGLAAHPAQTAAGAGRGAVDEVLGVRDDALPARSARITVRLHLNAGIISACTRSIASRCCVDGDFVEIGGEIVTGRSAAAGSTNARTPQKLARDREKSRSSSEAVVCGFGDDRRVPGRHRA